MDTGTDSWMCFFYMRSGEVVRINLSRAQVDKVVEMMPIHGERMLAHGLDASGSPYAVRLDCVESVISKQG